jgi:AcrR family transcriptional regulator
MFNNNLPATDKGEQTRKLIYESALQLFRDKSFESTTMREVAAAAGVALGSAYYYFPSKEAILQSYYETVHGEHARRLREDFSSGKRDLRERLKFAIQSKLDIVRDDRRLLGVVFRYSGEPDHPLSCLGKATEGVRRESIELFSEAVGDERLPADLRRLLPLAVWSLHMGVLILFIYDQTPAQQRTRKLVDAAIDLTVGLLSMAKTPLLKPVRNKILKLLDDADLIPAFDISGGRTADARP